MVFGRLHWIVGNIVLIQSGFDMDSFIPILTPKTNKTFLFNRQKSNNIALEGKKIEKIAATGTQYSIKGII